MLVDSHAHLEDEKYDRDREKVIEECKKDLTFLINVGSNLLTSKQSIELAHNYDFIYASVGIHPHDAQREFDKVEEIERLALQEKVVAIGEIGLDYYYDDPPKEFQKEIFIKQIRLAKKLNLPIIIHDRDAHGDILDILKQEWTKDLRGVFHSYSGSVEMAFQVIEMNFYISLGGPVTFKNAKKPKEVAKAVPIEKLLIETDSPYLTPEPYRGKRNTPVYVKFVAKKIAELREMPYEEVCRITAENAIKLFNIPLK
ncbi:TatD DNase family protein [Thermoanaerobacter thermohydrosulfuricus]|uniref:Hydrolase, TatD family n=3 Tax=Thermoanaerobacter TaxID=1754 RepID=G2MVW9_9THEO|nr:MULTISPECIES: TatD family hydrolase [Thermoanaerobacter]EGD53006.1 hydrolase, TatD family [Thermoanaerobacter ethanolicus JW 200]AEM77632.1 hydrolase, TatD family [Thermoanaerobacter wiegelii Rt8.B1]EMT38478.1 hydrolase, TatD family [Thermoanaerobacter thermohydrosulfuricus WC1]UZQ84265.1 TatD family hydrolase [Thermoanaerobacter sp. RKWS2]SDG33119.1 TatD DNase family protein [Thermoanaerobacter thermohydrosulfuricus]